MTPEEQAAYLAYLLELSGLTPSAATLSQGSAPLEPSSSQKRGLDYRQDYNNLLLDQVTRAQAGPGGFDFDTFRPVVKDEPVTREGEQLLQFYLSRGDGSWEKIIAEEIASGGSASSAFGIINAIINGQPQTEEDAALQQALVGSIPPKIDFATGESIGPDLETVYNTATELQTKVATDPVGNYQDPITGQWYNRVEEPSEASKFWTDRGLPTPDKQYDWRMLLGHPEGAPTPLEAMAASRDQLAPLQEKAKAAEAALQRYLQESRQQGPPGPGFRPEGPARESGVGDLLDGPSLVELARRDPNLAGRQAGPPGPGFRPEGRRTARKEHPPPDRFGAAMRRLLEDTGLTEPKTMGLPPFLGGAVGERVVGGLADAGSGLLDKLGDVPVPRIPGLPNIPAAVRGAGIVADEGYDVTRGLFGQGGASDAGDTFRRSGPPGPGFRNGRQPDDETMLRRRRDTTEAAYTRALLDRNRAVLPQIREMGAAAGRSAAARQAGRTPLIDALLAARMQQYVTGL